MGSSEHFDQTAATYDDPVKERRAEEIAHAIAVEVPLGPGTRLLEYGAGTGLVTRALARLSDGLAITLADNSSGMREVLRSKVAAGTLPADSHVVELDLEHDEPPAERFDVVVSSLVLHHVRDLDAVLSGFAAVLEQGGVVAVADLDREDGSFHRHLHDFDGHHGFDRPELTAAVERVGFTEVAVRDCTELDKEGVTYSVFLATASKA